jgi:hypothetical protein
MCLFTYLHNYIFVVYLMILSFVLVIYLTTLSVISNYVALND